MKDKQFRLSSVARSVICTTILVFLIALEWCLGEWLFGRWTRVTLWIACISILVVVGGFLLLLHCKGIRWPHLSVFRKIFQSMVSSWLPIIILLFFLIHVEWISNAGYDALFGDEGFKWENIVMFFAGIVAIFLSICLYPFDNPPKPANERSLLVCGLSLPKDKDWIRPLNVDLLIKPFLENEWIDKNGQPLIAPKIKKMVIIPSVDKLPPFESLNEINRKIFDYYNGDDLLTEYNQIVNSGKDTPSIFQSLIKLFSGQDVVVELAGKVDYDNMNESLARINEELMRYETSKGGIRRTDETLLYISPGTGVIGSALTAFSIPGERVVLYFTQTKKNNHLLSIGLQTGGNNSIMEELLSKE